MVTRPALPSILLYLKLDLVSSDIGFSFFSQRENPIALHGRLRKGSPLPPKGSPLPPSTTFIVPVEIFPARLRSTCHGISAASGKLGAIIGSFGFLYLAQSHDPAKTDHGYPPGIGVRNSLFLLAGCTLLGFFFTFLVPESKGKSLEEMSRENEDEGPAAESNVAVGYSRTAPVV